MTRKRDIRKPGMQAAKRPLTPKQEKFCNEYLLDLNATQAAIRTGYSEKTAYSIGHENLNKPEIQERIAVLRAELSKKTGVTPEYVIGTIMETVDRCRQVTPVLDSDGNETGEFVFKEHGVLKGCELLGKHLKLFTDKHEHTGKDGGPIKTESDVRISPAESYSRLIDE